MRKTVAQRWISEPVNRFISESYTSGIVLFFATVLALFCANTSLQSWYHGFWEHQLGFEIDGQFFLNKSLHHWINDGLMAIFFFVVGLELKRELIGGQLSDARKALLPVAAAFGGMIFPALIYLLFNQTGAARSGWGIPMATDIAFALGVLHLLGKKIPVSVKVFLTVLAVADDLGAVLVIAFFYTSSISIFNLGIGFAFLAFLVLANRLGVRSAYFYAIFGIGGVWLFFLLSGVHATIAAVLIAFTIPATTLIDERAYIKKIQSLLLKFKNQDPNNHPILENEQLHTLDDIKKFTVYAMTPLQRLENNLHRFVSFIVIPIFAFANAGVTFSGVGLEMLFSPVALGVIAGLLFGKIIGIVGISSILIQTKIASFPTEMTFGHLFGIGFLASIGFTMSLFVTELAFVDKTLIIEAKIGIFVASIVGGLAGFLILKLINKSK
jgi:NhaA family Na+:H+ antiporter